MRRRFLCRRLVHRRRLGLAVFDRRRLGPRRDSLHDRRLRPQPDQRDRVRLGLHRFQRNDDPLPRLRPARQRRGSRPAADPDRPERADHGSVGGQRRRIGPLERFRHRLLSPGRLRLVRPDGDGHRRSVRLAEGELPQRDGLRRRRRRHHGSVQQALQLHRLPSRARLADGHRLQQRQRQLDGFGRDHRRLERTERDLRFGRRRLLHGDLDRGHTRQRVGYGLRRRRGERHRRARRGSARQRRRHLRRLPGLLEQRHAERRQRHHRRQRQLLPLPLPPLRPRRQPGRPRAPARRPRSTPRPRPRRASATARWPTQPSPATPSTSALRPATASSRSRRLRATSSRASRATASRRRPRAGAPPARATPAPTATPARRAIRPSRTTSARSTAPACTSAASGFTVTPDASAPSGISASVTGGYYTAISIAVTLDNGSDSGSGIDAASGIVERDEAPLDNGDGSCDAFPGSWSSVTLSGGNDTTITSGKCYRYRYLLSDRVGNQATSGASATAKVDTSAPAVPTLTFGSLQAAFVAGSTVYYRPSATSGQFAVTAASTDGQSGVASYGFPAARLRLERLRLGRHAHLQPLRLARPIRPSRTTSPRSTAPASPRALRPTR